MSAAHYWFPIDFENGPSRLYSRGDLSYHYEGTWVESFALLWLHACWGRGFLWFLHQIFACFLELCSSWATSSQETSGWAFHRHCAFWCWSPWLGRWCRIRWWDDWLHWARPDDECLPESDFFTGFLPFVSAVPSFLQHGFLSWWLQQLSISFCGTTCQISASSDLHSFCSFESDCATGSFSHRLLCQSLGLSAIVRPSCVFSFEIDLRFAFSLIWSAYLIKHFVYTLWCQR